MYATDYDLELPSVVDGLIVNYAEQHCRIVVDEHCDLIRLDLRAWTSSVIKPAPSIKISRDSTGDKNIIFQEAREAVKRCADHIRKICGIPDLIEVGLPDYTDSRFRNSARQRRVA